jgi:hypothetical protein
MSERFRCSVVSRDTDESLHATASQVRSWVLVEEPSGWGHDALLQSRLPPEVAIALRAKARAVGARILLIRRHGRNEADNRQAFFAATMPTVRRLEQFTVDHPAELLDLSWEPLASGGPVGGTPQPGPLFLVCTNGRHDPCCAEFGRPVAQALARAFGDSLWESSHYGGDRFAGNLVCLPDGVYYGRVTPLNAMRLGRDLTAGRLNLDVYRGRCAFPFAVQAAEQFVREHTGDGLLAGVTPVSWHDLGDGLMHVELSSRGERLVVTVQAYPDAEASQLTCYAKAQLRPLRFRLLSIEDAA